MRICFLNYIPAIFGDESLFLAHQPGWCILKWIGAGYVLGSYPLSIYVSIISLVFSLFHPYLYIYLSLPSYTNYMVKLRFVWLLHTHFGYILQTLINLDSPKDNNNSNNSNININMGDLMEIERDMFLWFLIYNADFNKKMEGFHGKCPSNASW